MDHMEGTVLVFKSKIAANARVRAHTLMQLSNRSLPCIPYNAPIPHACKQVLNACSIETLKMVVLLLLIGPSLSTDKWPCNMEAPLVCTIHRAHLIIHIMSLGPLRSFPIPNEQICQCSADNGQIQIDINMATSPLPSQGPHGGEKSIWLHNTCRLKVPVVGRDQYGPIKPVFWGPHGGEKST